MVWRTWRMREGVPLVLLHGAAGSWTHWIRNVPALAAARPGVVAADLPGFGDSDMPPEPYSAQSLADVVADGMTRLVPGRVDLAGFSFGAIIAGLVAARLGTRVRRLVLVAPNGMALPRAELRPLVRPGPDASLAELREAHRENLGIMMLADPARVDDVAVDLQLANVRRARVKSGAIPDSDVLLRALPSVRARIGGIWGARDALAAPYIDRRRAALARVQPGLDFRVLPGAGHWVLYEAPAAVNAAMLDMLAAEGE
jgi:pimeloyl-ACP methyl ester carboxylesterase